MKQSKGSGVGRMGWGTWKCKKRERSSPASGRLWRSHEMLITPSRENRKSHRGARCYGPLFCGERPSEEGRGADIGEEVIYHQGGHLSPQPAPLFWMLLHGKPSLSTEDGCAPDLILVICWYDCVISSILRWEWISGEMTVGFQWEDTRFPVRWQWVSRNFLDENVIVNLSPESSAHWILYF